MNTGLIIKRLRESEGLSQAKLAASLGITRVYLSQLENGKKQGSLDILRDIAARFDLPLSLLLAWEEPDGSNKVYRELRLLFSQLLEAKIKIAREAT